jgi:hypothetical protein
MILYPPVRFDANEWYTIIFIALSLIISLMLPKRFPTVFTLNIILFVACLAKFTDFLLAAGIPFDFYDYSDTPKLDWYDEYLQLVLYPLVGYLFMYIYDIWLQEEYSKLLFIALCTFSSAVFEWLALKAHVFTYKGWRMAYSIPCYVTLMTMYIIFFHLMKRWIKIKI